MNHLRTNIFDEYKKEKEKADYFQKQASDWQEKYYELLNELKKTQALLRQFLNENTPSSKLPFKNKINESEKEPKPRGKPVGSNGGNKEAPENIKINPSAIQKHISKLKKKGILKRVGPDKGGYWKIAGREEK